MNSRRSNIAFDHFINFIRKDERDFILDVLRKHKEKQAIKLIEDTIHVPYIVENNEDGTSIKGIK